MPKALKIIFANKSLKPPFSMSSILSIRNVSKQYATHKALNNISLEIPKNCIFGLLGPNGAGKTTLIRTITQIISLDTGEIYFDGQKLAPHHVNQMGYLPEERGLYKKMKVGEQLVYLARLKGLSAQEARKRILYWVERLDMKGWSEKNIEDLSKGMQQKVQFVATVLHEPKFLILDEPFSGFDPINAEIIKNEILELKKKGITILFSTHRMESVEELCDQIALINRSEKILDGKTKEIKKQYKNNSYKVSYEGNLQSLPQGMHILSHQIQEDGIHEALISLDASIKANELLTNLITQVEIHNFQENIPTMNDIFIKLVGGVPQNA
jgi:ABC-2 type transport system ATP-binding protein